MARGALEGAVISTATEIVRAAVIVLGQVVGRPIGEARGAPRLTIRLGVGVFVVVVVVAVAVVAVSPVPIQLDEFGVETLKLGFWSRGRLMTWRVSFQTSPVRQ